MKKIIILLFLIIFSLPSLAKAYTTSDIKVYESDNHKYYGLKISDEEIITKPEYRKLIRLGETSWIFQKKNYKFGLMDCEGNILVEPKYVHVERLFDKWVKLGNDKDYGLYDAEGKIIIPPKFRAIEPLFGKKFLTYKNYKYGIYSENGEELLPNKYDFIYMPTPKILRIKEGTTWYEIENISTNNSIEIPDETLKEFQDDSFKITKIVKNTGVGAGYGFVTATDYTLKIFSTISLAYEETIDELMLSKGVETISILAKFSWIPKFPFIYAKKYYESIFEPDSGPLSGIRNDLIEQMK